MPPASPPAAKPVSKPRPLSPHLQVYRPQLTSGLSIFHRGTGIALCGLLLLAVYWLVELTRGAEAYEQFITCLTTLPGQVILCGFAFAFFFHLCTGIRHLCWDAGKFLEIKQVYITGYVAIAMAAVLTALFLVYAYHSLPYAYGTD